MLGAWRAWVRAMSVAAAALFWTSSFLMWRDENATVAALGLAALALPATVLAWRQVVPG